MRTGRPKKPVEQLKRSGQYRADRHGEVAAVSESPLRGEPSEDLIADMEQVILEVPGYDPHHGAEEFHFDEDRAREAVKFFHNKLTHVKGEKARTPFILERWQQAIIANLFGWYREDGTRRYREAFLLVPRKNGKTPMAAGIITYLLFMDGEPGAEIYGAASEYKQASLVFEHARGMVTHCAELLERCKIYAGQAKAIQLEEDWSTYRVVSSDAFSAHGWNTHAAVIDELHTQPNRDLVDTLITSTGARRQPIIIHITTADFARDSICNEKHDYAAKVRDRVIDDPSFLPVIYEASVEDDWTDPDTWHKANPNLGVSVKFEYLERECKRAQETPTFENTFKRLHLNIRTEQDVRWLQMPLWDKCAGEFVLEELAGRECYGGLDLSSKLDVSAFVLIFPPKKIDDAYLLLSRFWIPRENALKREREDRVPYLTWAKHGFITLTEGNVVDYEFIKAEIAKDVKRFKMVECGFDPWNATQISLQLGDLGATMVEVNQGFKSLSEPTKELEKLIVSKNLIHDSNPVMRWMVSNAAAELDPAGNIKPSKKKSKEKIDGVVAAIVALSRAMLKTYKPSVYETRGLLRI